MVKKILGLGFVGLWSVLAPIIVSGDADIIVLGNSMIEEGIDEGGLANLTGYKVKLLHDPGAMTTWQYLMLKNIIAVADNKPRMVVMVERLNVFTRPQYRNGIVNDVTCPNPKSAARYLAVINRVRGPEEKEVDEKAYPPDGEGDNPDMWNFKEALKKSLLPNMVRVAKEAKIHLVIARHKTRWHTENPGQETEEQKKYGKELKAYLESNGCTFLEYSYSPKLTIEHYADGDHLNGNGRTVWTTLMAEDLKKVMDVDLPKILTKSEELPKKQSQGQSSAGINCPKTESPPTIDGILSDSCWQEAKKITDFVVNDTSKLAKEQTIIFLVHDTNNLYIGVSCIESKMNKLSEYFTKNDDKVHNDDSIGVYLTTDKKNSEYYCLYINPKGTVRDGKVSCIIEDGDKFWNFDKTWSSNIKVKTSKEDNMWFIEMSLPLSSFGKNVTWMGMNFLRKRIADRKETSWSFMKMSGSNYLPEGFSNVMLSP